MVRQVEAVELGEQVGTQPAELLLVRHGYAPGQAQRVLDLLQFQHEAEDFVVVGHHFARENCA